MKKIILLFISIIFSETNAQIVFCPPGAEWHYNFSWLKSGPVYSTTYYNEPVTYVGDSLVDSQLVKVLKHNHFFTGSCNAYQSNITLIKQIGDTVFFRNANTEHDWQILYNFAALQGDSWQNSLYVSPGNYLNYTVTVDSVGSVLINNFNLKRLYVKYYTSKAWPESMITERLGSSGYLFNFYTPDCDGPSIFNRNLCYQDSTFGLKQFSSTPCNYSTAAYAGLEEEKINEGIKLYPNPVTDILKIKSENNYTEINKLSITNTLGQIVLIINVPNQERDLDLGFLPEGIYYLKLQNNAEQKIFKIIRE